MKKVRYGVIGIKGIGSVHLDAAKRIPNLELTAVADVDKPFVEKKAEELGVHAFTDYRTMLSKGIVDAVSIATPNHLHGEMGLECLNAGVHVFMEKPIALRISETNAMLKVCQARHLKICVGHQYRTYRFARKLKSLIDSGALGKILRVLWTWIEFRPEYYYRREPWRTMWRTAGGGVLMISAIHHLDLMCWLIGKPIQVSAMMGNQRRKRHIEDIVCANILFESGAFATFQTTINQPRTNNVCQIAGEKGLIIVPELRSLIDDEDEPIIYGSYSGDIGSLDQQMTGTWDQPAVEWRWLNSERNGLKGAFNRLLPRNRSSEKKPFGHLILMESFIKAILDDGQPAVTGESVSTIVELVNAIILSAVKKKTVDLPLDPDEIDRVYDELSGYDAPVSSQTYLGFNR